MFRVRYSVRAGDAHINFDSLHRFPPCEDIVRSKTGYLPMPFYSSKRVFCENAGRFACFGVFFIKTCRDFLAPMHFLPKRTAFCSPRSIFHENAGRFARPDVFFVKTRNVLLVPKHFPQKRWLRFSKPPCGEKKNRPRLAARAGSPKKLSKTTGLLALFVPRLCSRAAGESVIQQP